MAARIFRPKISHFRKFCFGDIFLSFGDISVSFGGIFLLFGGISVSFGGIFLLNFRKWFKYGLKAQKLQKQHALNQRSPAEGKGKGQKLQKQHALKGQKLLAQGIALGITAISKAPCKGKSFVNCLVF